MRKKATRSTNPALYGKKPIPKGSKDGEVKKPKNVTKSATATTKKIYRPPHPQLPTRKSKRQQELSQTSTATLTPEKATAGTELWNNHIQEMKSDDAPTQMTDRQKRKILRDIQASNNERLKKKREEAGGVTNSENKNGNNEEDDNDGASSTESSKKKDDDSIEPDVKNMTRKELWEYTQDNKRKQREWAIAEDEERRKRRENAAKNNQVVDMVDSEDENATTQTSAVVAQVVDNEGKDEEREVDSDGNSIEPDYSKMNQQEFDAYVRDYDEWSKTQDELRRKKREKAAKNNQVVDMIDSEEGMDTTQTSTVVAEVVQGEEGEGRPREHEEEEEEDKGEGEDEEEEEGEADQSIDATSIVNRSIGGKFIESVVEEEHLEDENHDMDGFQMNLESQSVVRTELIEYPFRGKTMKGLRVRGGKTIKGLRDSMGQSVAKKGGDENDEDNVLEEIPYERNDGVEFEEDEPQFEFDECPNDSQHMITHSRSHESKDFKAVIKMMTARYQFRDDWYNSENYRESIPNIHTFFKSYWCEYGGYWIYSKEKNHVKAAVICETDHIMPITDYDKHGKEKEPEEQEVIIFHYTTEPDEYLELLVSYICCKHRDRVKWVFASIHLDENTKSAVKLKPSSDFDNKKDEKKTLEFWNKMGVVDLKEEPSKKERKKGMKKGTLWSEKILTENTLSRRRTLSTPELYVFHHSLFFPSEKFRDYHTLYGRSRFAVAKSIFPRFKTYMMNSYNTSFHGNHITHEKNLCSIIEESSREKEGITFIDHTAVEHYIVYGFVTPNTDELRCAVFTLNPFMGLWAIPMEYVRPAAMNNIKNAMEELKKRSPDRASRTAIVRSTLSGSTGGKVTKSTGYEDFVENYEAEVNNGCAWLSLMAMMKDLDPQGHHILRRMFEENPHNYENMTITNTTLAKNSGVLCLADVLRHHPVLSYTMQRRHLKKPGVTWLQWLKDESITGNFICHLKTNCHQQTHAVGLRRDGGGKGMIYNSIINQIEFVSSEGFNNFSNVYDRQIETVKDFLIVMKIDVPVRGHKVNN